MSHAVEREIVGEVNKLLTLANDLCMAYATAIRRIEDPHLQAELDALDRSHDRYRAALGDWVRRHGREETGTGDWRGVVERMRVVLGDLSGDAGILRAMATNEAEMVQAFREVQGKPDMPYEVVAIIDNALKHEQRLRDFYERALASL